MKSAKISKQNETENCIRVCQKAGEETAPG
jgi:hypothetical protein